MVEKTAAQVLEIACDWVYQQVIKLLSMLFTTMNEMGIDLFDMPWAKMLVQLFGNIGWALFAVGIVVAGFEFAIESQNGRGDMKHTALNVLKGFFAVSLFTTLPIQLYVLAIDMQESISGEMCDMLYITADGSLGGTVGLALTALGFSSSIFNIITILIMGYAIVKVFFASLKRGGILLIQIAIGSLYMFSIPRGYTDGFVMWVKQVIANCLTAFLQSAMLVCGLLVCRDNFLLGLGVMLAAGEIPRIAGAFGLETTTRANVQSVVYTAQSAVNLTRTIKAIAAK